MTRPSLAAAALTLALGLSSPVSAQAPAPDVVLTHDGGMMRGTIIESVPGDHVTIQLANGEARTLAWDRVRFAGPESERPSPEPPVPPPPPQMVRDPGPSYAPPAADTVRIRVETEQEGVAVHEVTGTATATAWTGQGIAMLQAHSFRRLCGAPCELTLERGSHQFALSRGGDPVPTQPFDLMTDGVLSAHYVDRTGLRVAGWVTFAAGGVAGVTWMVVPIATTDLTNDDWLFGLLGGGIVLLVAEIVGLIMAVHGDSAEVQFNAF